MIVTASPLVAAGMPLQRTSNGFLGKRMRPRLPTAADIHAGNIAHAVQGDGAAALAAIEAAVAPSRFGAPS